MCLCDSVRFGNANAYANVIETICIAQANTAQRIFAIMAQLSIETKTKIVTMRNYTSHTWAEIAADCGCSVS